MAYQSQSLDELNQYNSNQQINADETYYYGNSSVENYSNGYYSSSSLSLSASSSSNSPQLQSGSPTNQFYMPTPVNNYTNSQAYQNNYYGYNYCQAEPEEKLTAYNQLNESSDEESDVDDQNNGDDLNFVAGLDLTPNPMDSIQIELTNKSLWNKFHVHTTEMILTKQGRKMFPTIQYMFKGLDPLRKYNIYIDMVKVTPNTWKYQAGKWIECPASYPEMVSKQDDKLAHLHPDSPNTGAFWMKNEILFAKLKLTNNKVAANENILLLNSMHKYVPRLHIVCLNEMNLDLKKPKLSQFSARDVKTFLFNETQFIAVTAYLNRAITDLKIEYNPFAKGFRDITEQQQQPQQHQTIANGSNDSLRALPNTNQSPQSRYNQQLPLQLNTTSTPKINTNYNTSYHYIQENLTPKSAYNFNGYQNSTFNTNNSYNYKTPSLNATVSSENSIYNYPSYQSYYNYYTTYNNNSCMNTNKQTVGLTNTTQTNLNAITNKTCKRKYDETVSQEDSYCVENNVDLTASSQAKYQCSSSYNVLNNNYNANNVYFY